MLNSYTTEIETAISAARAAAEVVNQMKLRQIAVRHKEDGTLVSSADEEAEKVIREIIGSVFPDDSILGEENGLSGNGERCWVVDPLDNSACFLRHSPEYAIILGLLSAQQPVLGVVLTPSDGSLWWAVASQGAWGPGGERLCGPQNCDLSTATVSFASLKYWRALGLDRALGNIVDISFHESLHGGFRAMLGVAAGSIDVSLDPWGKIWDHAGLVPILRESGCAVRRLDVGSRQCGLVTGGVQLLNECRGLGLPVSSESWTAASYPLLSS